MTELDPEDAKLVTLARSARARTGAAAGRRGARRRRPHLRRRAVALPSLALSRAAGRGRDGGLVRRARARGRGRAR